ncbi:MAG: hypothetical protein V7L13_29420 [Nostoc sp.]|uniref:hypothetical protein n=1 Tax=Nostoc sp. TaxID=1180 RepID=UPI002FF705F2
MTATPQEYLAALQEKFTQESYKYSSQINKKDLVKANTLSFKREKLLIDIANNFSDPNTQDNLYKSHIFRFFINNLNVVYDECVSEGECNVGTMYLKMRNYIYSQVKISRDWEGESIQNLRSNGLDNLQAETEKDYRQLKNNLDQQLLSEFQRIIQDVRDNLQNSTLDK